MKRAVEPSSTARSTVSSIAACSRSSAGRTSARAIGARRRQAGRGQDPSSAVRSVPVRSGPRRQCGDEPVCGGLRKLGRGGKRRELHSIGFALKPAEHRRGPSDRLNAYPVLHYGTRILYSGIVSYAADVFEHGQDGYERARRAACWNARTPERFPEAIVLAAQRGGRRRAPCARPASEGMTDRRALRRATAGRATTCATGACCSTSRACGAVEVDAAAMTATVQPGCPANELLAALGAADLFFPAGHCVGVAVGGYLLQGGYGWNGRVHGPACMSVEAIDVVTADGELVHADARRERRPAVGGARRGPGLLRRRHPLSPAPARRSRRSSANGAVTYPRSSCSRRSSRWAHEIGPQVPRTMELMLIIAPRRGRASSRSPSPGRCSSTASSEARDALALLETCPVLEQAKLAVPNIPAALRRPVRGRARRLPGRAPLRGRQHVDARAGRRAAAGPASASPRRMPRRAVAHAVDELGPGPHRARARPDMAYSVEDDTYIALYGVWQDPAEDDANVAWVTDADARDGAAWRAASSSPTRTSAGARRGSSATSSMDAAGSSCGRAATRTAAFTHGWAGRPRADERRSTLSDYLTRPLEPPEARCSRRSSAGPIDPGRRARRSTRSSALLDPAPLRVENGWCTLADGVGYVAVAHGDAGGERRDDRLVVRLAPARVRCATASGTRARTWSNSVELPVGTAAARSPLGRGPSPVEDVGMGVVHARIAFQRAERDGLLDRRARRSARRDDRLRLRRRRLAGACATRRCSTCSCARATACCCAADSGSARRCVPTAPLGAPGERLLNNRRGAQPGAARSGCPTRSPSTAPRSTRTWPRCCRSSTPASAPTRALGREASARARASAAGRSGLRRLRLRT